MYTYTNGVTYLFLVACNKINLPGNLQGYLFVIHCFSYEKNLLEAVVWKCSAKKVLLKFLKIYSKKPVPVTCNFI